MFKDLKIELPIHRGQHNMVYVHLGIILIILVAGTMENMATYGENGALVTSIVVIAVFITLLSLADKLDIIELRKSSHRLTRCALCGRTSEKENHDEKGKIVKTIEVKGDISSTTKEMVHETEKAIPLHGIAIEGKLVCTNCLTELSKFKWEK